MCASKYVRLFASLLIVRNFLSRSAECSYLVQISLTNIVLLLIVCVERRSLVCVEVLLIGLHVVHSKLVSSAFLFCISEREAKPSPCKKHILENERPKNRESTAYPIETFDNGKERKKTS